MLNISEYRENYRICNLVLSFYCGRTAAQDFFTKCWSCDSDVHVRGTEVSSTLRKSIFSAICAVTKDGVNLKTSSAAILNQHIHTLVCMLYL